MSCTAPIDIPTSQNVNTITGTFNCIYDADMLSGQSVTLAADLSHLTIPCGASRNNSKVSFYTAGTYVPTEIRIYRPSLHTYNGAPADAELLIVHSAVQQNRGSDGLIVSVPISIGGGSGTSGLDAVIQAANTLNARTVALTPSAAISQDVNANDFIPSKKYYVYNGTLPYESCGGNYYYAVFTDPIAIAGPFNNVVASGIAVTPSPPPLLQKSKSGPNVNAMANAEDETALFEIIQPPEDCDPNPTNGSNGGAFGATSTSEMNVDTLYVLWGLLICFVLWFLWFIWKYMGADSAASTVVNAASTVVNAASTVVNAATNAAV
jgi:carbonic anhydrase